MTAGVAQIVGTLQLTAVRAFLESLDAQGVMAAAHTAAGRRSFALGDSHVGTLFRIMIWLCDWPVIPMGADANGAADPCGPDDREALRL